MQSRAPAVGPSAQEQRRHAQYDAQRPRPPSSRRPERSPPPPARRRPCLLQPAHRFRPPPPRPPPRLRPPVLPPARVPAAALQPPPPPVRRGCAGKRSVPPCPPPHASARERAWPDWNLRYLIREGGRGQSGAISMQVHESARGQIGISVTVHRASEHPDPKRRAPLQDGRHVAGRARAVHRRRVEDEDGC